MGAEKVAARNELEGYLYGLKNQVNDKEKLGGKLSEEDVETINDALETAIEGSTRTRRLTPRSTRKKRRRSKSSSSRSSAPSTRAAVPAPVATASTTKTRMRTITTSFKLFAT